VVTALGWIDRAVLTHEVNTPLGSYQPGLPVRTLAPSQFGRVAICLDPAEYHPAGRCHKATVPTTWLRSTELWRPVTRKPVAA